MLEPTLDAALVARCPILQVKLLGTPELWWAGQRVTLTRHRNRGLLYVLAARLVPVSRDALQGLLWPDDSPCHARRALTQAITQLRAELPPPAAPRCDREAVWLDDAAVSSDAAACDALAVGPPSGWSTERAEAIVALHRGRFLDGVAGGHRLEFEEWVLAEADRHERTLLGALGELARRYADAGRFHEAAAVAGRALRLDPYDERMHRLLLAVCEATDDRSGAIEHYRRCEDVLRRDLGVTPEPATRRAFESAMGERAVLARAS